LTALVFLQQGRFHEKFTARRRIGDGDPDRLGEPYLEIEGALDGRCPCKPRQPWHVSHDLLAILAILNTRIVVLCAPSTTQQILSLPKYLSWQQKIPVVFRNALPAKGTVAVVG